MAAPTNTSPPHRPFEALGIPGFRAFVATYMLTMMADNVEHVISYWVAFQKFNSPALGGFAVISHWLPFLLFSFGVGSLNDRFDSRRLIQIGGGLFMLVSLGWGYFFITDTLTMGAAMVLLVLHGMAGVFWSTSSQVLLYGIAGTHAGGASLPSAIRLASTARYLGLLVGPGVGSLILTGLGPSRGIAFNALLYLPLIVWLARTPHGSPHARGTTPSSARARGFGELATTLIAVRKLPALWVAIFVSGAASFFIGNSYHAQMPGFARDLGGVEPGRAYAMLLGADAAGALLAGLTLELGFRFTQISLRASIAFALAWGASLSAFAITRSYAWALAFLFAAGFCELSFSSMNQTLVQLSAPHEMRGKVLGLFGMSASGLRLFSGICVGLVGGWIGIHASLLGATLTFMLLVFWKSRLPTLGNPPSRP